MSPHLALPSPLMGAVRLILFPVLSAVPLLSLHSRFVLQWGDSDDLGCTLTLITLKHALREGRALLLGGCPLLPLSVRGPPLLPLL